MTRAREPLQPPLHPAEDSLLPVLRDGALTLEGLMPWSSNYTFLGHIGNGPDHIRIVYKPTRGEQPLWDFPRGTLAKRETAAYQISRALRWNLVPPTVLRRGPHGIGSVQLFADADQDAHFFTLHEDPTYRRVLQALALFDVAINNADRKGGHCLAIGSGHIVAIDHGLCFNVEPKLRTVIWDFAGEPIPADLAADLNRVRGELAGSSSALVDDLMALLSHDEIAATRHRFTELIQAKQFPDPPEDRRPYPWPLV
jgi:hypothetical protein